MEKKDVSQASTKRRSDRQTSKQSNTLIPASQRPITGDEEAWRVFWEAREQPWRTELEIDESHQPFPIQHRSILPDVERGICPVKALH